MFDFLKSFFGDSDAQSGNTPSKVEKALQALDIDVAIASHENWKIRLQAHLNGTSTETLHAETICFDDQCDLGKWIYGPGQRLGHYPGFQALINHHKMFHYSASNVVSLHNAGKNKEAQSLLNLQFENFSKDVIEDLQMMKKISTKK